MLLVVVVWLEAMVEVDCLDAAVIVSAVCIELLDTKVEVEVEVEVEVVVEVEVQVEEAEDMTVPDPRSRMRVEFLQHELSDPQQKWPDPKLEQDDIQLSSCLPM
jgi:hypothetical protein